MTKSTVATVNSRLQRAQAKLEERLQRRLADRCGGMRGALLALVGWPEAAGAAFTPALIAKLAVGAASAVVVLSLWLGRGAPDEGAAPLVAQSASAEEAAHVLAESREDPVARTEAAPPAPAPEVVGTPLEAPLPARFAFELAIEPLDAQGRALAACRVWLGPAPGPLALVGETAWDGALRLAWRGDEPEVDLVVRAARVGHGSTTLRSVRVRAGVENVVRLGLEGAPPVAIALLDALRLDALRPGARSGSAPGLDSGTDVGSSLEAGSIQTDIPLLSALSAGDARLSTRPRRDESRFLVDSAGNGVFEDPWIVAAPEAAQDAVGPLRLESLAPLVRGQATGPEALRAWLEVRAVDEHGRALPRSLVSICAADGYRQDVEAGPSGSVHDVGVPPGSVLVAASQASAPESRSTAYPVATLRLELAPGERRTVDVHVPRSPVARIRLVDADGMPRGAWQAELRDASGSTLARVELDADGRGVLPIESGAPAILLARADRSSTGVVVEQALFAHEREQTFVAAFAPHVR